MSTTRRQFSASFKAQIALKALKEIKTVKQIAAEHQLHPNLVVRWRQDLLTQMPLLFERKDVHSELLQLYKPFISGSTGPVSYTDDPLLISARRFDLWIMLLKSKKRQLSIPF